MLTNMLTRRQIKICMEYCSNPDTFITASYFSKKLNISIRTVQTEIKAIKHVLNQSNVVRLVSVASKGSKLVIINKPEFEKFKLRLIDKYNNDSLLNEKSSRINYILSFLLKTKRYITMGELSDITFVSESTLSNDLKLVKKILERYNLQIINKLHYGLKVEGSERNKRLCLIKENLLRIESLTNPITQEKLIPEVKDIVLEVLVNYRYRISDVLFQNLIIHISTAIWRMSQGFFLEPSEIELDSDYERELEISRVIFNRITQKIPIVVSTEEIKYLAINLKGKCDFDNDTYISSEINDFILDSLLKIKSEFGVDFTDNVNLRISLGLHFIPLITRMKFNMQLKDSIFVDIKQAYPFAFDIATYFAYLIQAKYHTKLNEDEISYLALHFNYALLNYRDRDIIGTKKVLIVSSLKRSATILLRQKLIQWFSNQISEINIVNPLDLNEIDLSDYDLIFTTEHNDLYKSGIAIFINYFPDENDYKKMNLAINGFKSKKDIMSKFSKQLTYIGESKTREEILEKLCKLAEQKFKIEGSLIESVKLRESLGSTYFGNFIAMPHPIRPITNDTFVALGLLTNDLEWEDENIVRIVLLVCIEMNNPKAFQLWHYLANLVSNKELVNKVLSDITYKNFKSVLSESLNVHF